MNCENLKKKNMGAYLKNDISVANNISVVPMIDIRIDSFCLAIFTARANPVDDYRTLVSGFTNVSSSGQAA